MAIKDNKGHHKDVVRFLYWMERAKDFASELKKDKAPYKFKAKFLEMVEKLEKIKPSDLGV